MSSVSLSVIIFDLDGPILEGSRKHHACYADILKSLNHLPLPLEEYWQLKRKMVSRDKILAMSHAGSDYNTFLEQWHALIETPQYLKLDTIQPNVLHVLSELRKSSVRLDLVTMRNNPETLNAQLDELQLATFFDAIHAVSSKLGTKSKIETVKKILAGTPAASCLWVGDTEADITPARALGIPSCALSNGIRERLFLESLAPTFVIDSLSELLPIVENVQSSK